MKTLRNRISHLLTIVLLVLGMATAAGAQAHATPQRLTGSATICSNSPVPTGWFVTSSYNNSSCAGTGVAYTITDTSNLTSLSAVCSMSPVPAGWVITGSYNAGDCQGTGVAYSIRKA
nr:hypothetical protein KPHV_08020 [Kitasatospora purpeofusca]